jgi:hypothetical protein
VIAPPAGVRVLVATRPVDFRKGMDGLAAVAQGDAGEDPFSGPSWCSAQSARIV